MEFSTRRIVYFHIIVRVLVSICKWIILMQVTSGHVYMNEYAHVLIRAWVLLRIELSCRARHYCRLCRETVIQWGRRLHWKLSRHWLNGVWWRRGALIMKQGPRIHAQFLIYIYYHASRDRRYFDIYMSIFLLGFVFISCWQYCRKFFPCFFFP